MNSIEQCDYHSHDAPELTCIDDTIPRLREDDAKTLAWDVSRGTWPHISITECGLSTPLDQNHQTTNAKDKYTTSELIGTNKRERLIQFVSKTLSANNWRYYQGYHDVAGIFLSVLGDKDVKLFQKFTQFYLIDFVIADNLSILDTIFNFTVLPLLAYMDRDACDLLNQDDSSVFSRFCLPWILTWFSHDLSCVETTKRFFDACLASHPMFVIYASVSTIHLLTQSLHQSQSQCQSEFDDGEDDRIMKLLSPQACQNLPIQAIIDGALECMRRVPPRDLLDLSDRYHSNCVNESLESQIMHLSRSLKYTSTDLSKRSHDTLVAIAAGHGMSDKMRRKRRKMHRRMVVASALIAVLFFVFSFTLNDIVASRRQQGTINIIHPNILQDECDGNDHIIPAKALPKEENASNSQTKLLLDDVCYVNDGSHQMAFVRVLMLGKDVSHKSAAFANFVQSS